jgi:hypothetical protein
MPNITEDEFAGYESGAWEKKVNLRVWVYQRPHLRDEMLEYESYMGLGVLKRLFDADINATLPDVTHLFLPFPERWLNIVEERSLYPRLQMWCPNLTSLEIKTQSVYIIQCTQREHIGILKHEGPLPGESVVGRLWFPMQGTNIFKKGQLGIVGGTITTQER